MNTDRPEPQEVTNLIITWISKELAIDPTTIQSDTSFAAIGVDSLAAAEIRARVMELWGVTLEFQEIYDHATPARLGALVSKKLET